MELDKRIALRLPSEKREQIETLIKSGKYENLSELIRAALDQFLMNQTLPGGPL
jgi:Arc/MetJ-type ribon-helix-helix transcriptional regulator